MSRASASQDCFHAIADPTRRVLLDRLRHGERTAGELAEGIALSQPALSKHLRVLRESGLVGVRTVGRHRYYFEKPEALREAHDWLSGYETFWAGGLDRLGAHMRGKAVPGK
jgi:DNA-binding transcriptional ArsR family regulator